jgi:alpha-beta hydrolase superfamily lysophospholipase
MTRPSPAAALTCAVLAGVQWFGGTNTAYVQLGGSKQEVRLYGSRGHRPIIVSSGDGGWIHLGPHVAELLGSNGYFVVGMDARAYLELRTAEHRAERAGDVPRDFRAFIDFAAAGNPGRPILIGVSEGAGLSVLAATDPAVRETIDGVIGLGLGDVNELGWRWRDAVIYVTKGVPNEPTFAVADIVDRVAPAPLAAIHSTHDEFVPLSEVQSIFQRAKEPKKLWIVEASDHRFSGNLDEFDRRLYEALGWIRSQNTTTR